MTLPEFVICLTFTLIFGQGILVEGQEPLFVSALPLVSDGDQFTPAPVLLSTKTVYGFLDFTTTVGNTVMVFKPSKPAKEEKTKAISATSQRILPTAFLGESQSVKNLAVQAVKNPASKIKSSPAIFHVSSTIGIEGLFSGDNVQEIRGDSSLKQVQKQGQASVERNTKPTSDVLKNKFVHEVEIEGSLVHVDEASTGRDIRPTESLQSTTKKSFSSTGGLRSGVGFVSSIFQVVSQKESLSNQPQFSSRPGSKAKVSEATGIPKPIELRMQLNVQSKQDDRLQADSVSHAIVSKTSATMIRNGLTTVHETSVVGTTINGQYTRVTLSTSNVFQESRTESTVPSSARGTFEVVTEMPSIKGSGSAKISPSPVLKATNVPSKVAASPKQQNQPKISDEAKATPVVEEETLPSLESLFEGQSPNNKEKQLDDKESVEADDVPQTLSVSKPAEFAALRRDGLHVDDRQSKKDYDVSATEQKSRQAQFRSENANRKQFTIQPSSVRQVTTYTASSSSLGLERRAGTPFRQRTDEESGPVRPFRRDNRWRYSPSPKPKVNIRTENRPTIESSLRSTTQKTGNGDYEYTAGQNVRDEDLQDIEPTEVTTLRVHTVTPAGYSNINYEVATIKSPYIMRLGSVKTKRFVTLTKTFTRLITPTPSPAPIPSDEDSEILLEPGLPLTENILATTTPYESILKDSSDTATLPAIIVATESETVPLETITETFSTTEFMMKTSVLPYLRGDETSSMTLTQSYYITRVVTAVKTVPPSDLYQFIPSNTLKDFSTALQEAGSEHNERLLPGELEFSENDEYSDDEGRREKILPPPLGFIDSDLSNIGSEFDPESMDKPRQPEIQPSLVSTADYTESSPKIKGTPPLRNVPKGRPSGDIQPSVGNPETPVVETPALTPEQLQQLALFRYMNPYAAAGLPFGYPGLPGSFPGLGNLAAGSNGVQVVQTSRPVLKTTDIVRTDVVPIWDGVKTIYSTVTRTMGTTVVTETEYGTSVSVPTAVNPFQQYTVTSSPVTTEIMTTSTELRVYRIIFRAQTTFTTVTSTTVYPTVVTSIGGTLVTSEVLVVLRGSFEWKTVYSTLQDTVSFPGETSMVVTISIYTSSMNIATALALEKTFAEV
nr:EOG090X017N [Eulimnadia texana]